MNTAVITGCKKHVVWDISQIKQKVPPNNRRSIFITAIVTICITVTSGVCSKALSLSHPIFIEETPNAKIAYMSPIQQQAAANQAWIAKTNRKYQSKLISYPARGVAHIKMTKYINSKPIKINIVEANPSANYSINIKPQIAGQKLNSRAQIRTIAKKENAIAAVNAGYFKPQTGVPLGALMIDNKVLTGPIYNRVGIGIIKDDAGTRFVMDKVTMDIKISTSSAAYKADNINQPRMLSTYTLIYTPDWGAMSPMAPKYGKVAAIKDGRVVGASANQIAIPKDGFVISGPKAVIDTLVHQSNISYSIKLPDSFEGASHIIGAGPYLVKNAEVYVDITDEKFSSITGRNPRSAIGYTSDMELIIVTIDGREESSIGVTLWELAKIMKGLGCVYAMNFDGGGSSVMYVNGKITNSPAQKEGISISNALTISEITEPSQT